MAGGVVVDISNVGVQLSPKTPCLRHYMIRSSQLSHSQSPALPSVVESHQGSMDNPGLGQTRISPHLLQSHITRLYDIITIT